MGDTLVMVPVTHGDKPWHQAVGENSLWYERFRLYLEQTPPRSLARVWREECARAGKIVPTTAVIPGVWMDAREKFKWNERVLLYDIEEQRLLDEETDRVRTQWRRQQARLIVAEEKAEFAIAKKLRKKAGKMLDLPVQEQVVKYDEDGVPTDFIVQPGDARMFKAASDIYKEAKSHARSALGMVERTERQEVTGRDGGPMETANVTPIPPEERLAKLIALAEQVRALEQQGEALSNGDVIDVETEDTGA